MVIILHMYNRCMYYRIKNGADPIPPRIMVSGRVPYTLMVDVPCHRILGNELSLKHYLVMTLAPPYRTCLYLSPNQNHSTNVIITLCIPLVVCEHAVESESR